MSESRIKKIILVISVVIAAAMTMSIVHSSGQVLAYKRTQESLAKEVLRFHVLANSDSDQDQELKLRVKDAIINYMKDNLGQAESVLYTKVWAENHLEEIEDVAAEVIQQEGYDYLVQAELRKVDFPLKTYGDVTFPAGEYEALRVNIGEAKGQNWWCCLYPNLCFIDTTYAVVSEEGKEDLENVLEEDEYEMITTNTEFEFKWFFFR